MTLDHKDQESTATRPVSMYHLDILVRWKKFILINTFAIAVITSVITLLMPNWYKATASILPPKQQDILGSAVGAGSLLKGLAGGKALGSLGRNTGSYNYLAILKSRSTLTNVINRFHLMKVYDIDTTNIDKAIKELEGNTAFETQDDDNITIDVYDKDPVRASDMANYFVDILNATSIELGTQEARNNREFIGGRLAQCRSDLSKAEEALKEFQEKKEIFIAEDTKNSSVAAYAELYATKAKKEIEIAVLEKSVTPDNQVLRQLKSELFELSKKLSTFPEAGLEGLRLYREVIIQEKILEFLMPIYEEARIDEQKDIPVLLVLDTAVPPTRKAKPPRMLIVSLFTFLGFTITVFTTLFLNDVKRSTADNEFTKTMQRFADSVQSFYRVSSHPSTRE